VPVIIPAFPYKTGKVEILLLGLDTVLEDEEHVIKKKHIRADVEMYQSSTVKM
jgi:hypothetical protein